MGQLGARKWALVLAWCVGATTGCGGEATEPPPPTPEPEPDPDPEPEHDCDSDADCEDDDVVCNGAPVCANTPDGRRCQAGAVADDGAPCDDGDLCTTLDECQAGSCVGAQPVICDASDDCHLPGVCDPATGQCSEVNAPDDTPCDDGSLCTEDDVCTAGSCGGTTIECPTGQCEMPSTCDESTGLCPEPMPVLDGDACDDGDLCTTVDVCVAGQCEGAGAINCNQGDSCNQDQCNPMTGQCELSPHRNGGSCNDSLACTTGDRCRNGTCTGPAPDCLDDPPQKVCVAGNLEVYTSVGICSEAMPAGCQWVVDTVIPCSNGCVSGACIDTLCDGTNDGIACDDADPCTENDVCAAGSCAGTAKSCVALDTECSVGICDPSNGQCVAENLPDGVRCDDGMSCSPNDVCTAGVCTAGSIVEYGPNDAFPGAPLVGVNSATNNINRFGWGSFDNAADVDWYHYSDSSLVLALQPRVRVENLGNEPIEVCAYHECKNGNPMLPTDIVCFEGQLAPNPPAGMQGCCNTVAAGAGSAAEAYYNPECGSADQGEVYVSVSSAGVNGETCGYQLQWGDQ